MDHRWIKNLTDEARIKREAEVRSFKRAFEELLELIEDWDEVAKVDYNDSSWAFKQADINGANRMLRKIRGLINIKG